MRKEIEEILKKAEDVLTESIGRYQAQRFIYLFTDLGIDHFNLFEAIFDKGVEIGKSEVK